ncbi:ArsR/SmtB family transcription factor [Kallotenue papyrolyticum]|uniref:ArsR/SmtB family transcription factor n=1 Tax=Kallotenue papyrolyticum TaxID=1325125 RepID=UPI0004929151|nr:metalloregulator ArsR/SmtB family transcription factor [Kallotenue papyrolyticum]
MAMPTSSTPTITVQQAQLDARLFQGLADPIRVAILELLLSGERNVSEIVAALGLAQSRISNHLACLRWCGLVATRREGLRVYYRISDERVRQILTLGRALAQEHAAALQSCRQLNGVEAAPLNEPRAN